MSEIFADRLFNGMEREEPAAGKLLVAAPGMQSTAFSRTVILLLEHDANTTFGVDLAHRMDIAVANVLPDWVDCISKPQAMYAGGPVSPQSAVGVCVTKPDLDINSRPYFKKLANRLALVDLGAPPSEVKADITGMRMFIGYAEWSPGQLDEEIAAGEWYVAPCLPSDVTAAGSVDIWGDVMRRQAMPLPLFSTFPARLGEN